jgi:hypothetical protein
MPQEVTMGTMRKEPLEEKVERSLDEAAAELEQVGDEIQLKLHLAGMDANSYWKDKLEPRLFQARQHAREAKVASKVAVEETLKALREFSAGLER